MGCRGLAFETWSVRPKGDEKRLLFSNYSPVEAPPSPLSSRPKRTRISYFALLATTTCAALRKESRMQIIKATDLDRKSGGAQWTDLEFIRVLGHLLKPLNSAAPFILCCGTERC